MSCLINKTIQKSHIAKKIFASISENETIFLDVSSINYMVAELLAEEIKILFLLQICPAYQLFSEKTSGTEIIITGGNYNKEIGGIVGSEAINCINKYKVDKAYLGSCGINLETGAVMNFQSEDGNTKKAVLSIAKKNFL